MMSQILECKNVTKKYKDKKAVDEIDLQLEKGKIYGLIGRNGAGKTTLLSVMDAQSKATEGEVLLDNQKVWENKDALDHICFSRELSANTLLGNNTMKVKEYLKIASIYYKNWDMEMAQDLIEEFELDIKKRIYSLSKGMMSMVTIIVGLASKAEFTMMDEPVAGLDVVARTQFYKILLDEYEKTQRTFVISTHIIEEASDLFEEVIIMNNGKIMIKENTMDLLDRAFHISGKSEDVDEKIAGMEIHHVESLGRSKGVTVLAKPGQVLYSDEKVNVQPVSLQNLFVALCGNE